MALSGVQTHETVESAFKVVFGRGREPHLPSPSQTYRSVCLFVGLCVVLYVWLCLGLCLCACGCVCICVGLGASVIVFVGVSACVYVFVSFRLLGGMSWGGVSSGMDTPDRLFALKAFAYVTE